MRHALRLVPLLALGALLVPGTATAGANTTLHASVGPGPTISLTDASGARVTNLAPGTYDIVVSDKSDFHNFHLLGPGVDRTTSVEETGTETWTVTFSAGTYRYVCDPHASSMRGSFTVGTPAAAPKPTKLVATVGPAATITLRRPSGAAVTALKAGLYAITVRDRSARHNFRLIGPGVNRKTTVAFRGTVTWTVRLRAGAHRFVCDPHATRMKGSFRVR